MELRGLCFAIARREVIFVEAGGRGTFCGMRNASDLEECGDSKGYKDSDGVLYILVWPMPMC